MMRDEACPACGGKVAVSFFDGGEQPLATLALPESAQAAKAMKRLPLDYVRCVACGHVYNARFDWREVPHAEPPHAKRVGWGMYNRGATWGDFIQEMAARIARRLPPGALVVEIGHGEGMLLSAILELRQDVRGLGFDPHGAEQKSERLELRRAPALPESLPDFGADFVVARHVLEHLPAPLAFLQRTAIAASARARELPIYIEVPCIDRAIATRRTVDFFYEHHSQFTTSSFLTMLERAGATAIEHGLGYDGEVIYAFARLASASGAALVSEARAFDQATRASREGIRDRMRALSHARVVIWGGTGKSAAFIARYAAGTETVVDSDARKVGTYVPGTEMRIEPPSVLADNPPDVVVIPPQWRARDIVLEMRRLGVTCTVLIEHDGRLIDYERDEHPYAKPE